MRSAAAGLIIFAGNVLAHPGAEGHLHGFGIEHVLLIAVIFGVLAFAVRK